MLRVSVADIHVTMLGIGEVKRLRNGMAVAFPFPLAPAEVG
jgi:hypothetical protein